jgi:hypothetical protein
MQVTRIKKIFDEIARGLSLDRALATIAAQAAAETGAPTCKIWVVKRGDICEKCPLARACANREICMHLVATSGAALDKEYPRLPISIFNAPMISHGGAASFGELDGLGDRLFGLQHGANNGGRDSFALAPLKSSSGIIGLVGIFAHRPANQLDLEKLQQFIPAAVAAIRVAELQSRCEVLRAERDRQSDLAAAADRALAQLESEHQTSGAAYAKQISELQLDQQKAAADLAQALKRIAEVETEKLELCHDIESSAVQQQESARVYSQWAAHVQWDLQTTEEENQSLKQEALDLRQNLAQSQKERAELAGGLENSNRELTQVRAEAAEAKAEADRSRHAVRLLSDRMTVLEQTNAGLRDHSAALADSLDDFQQSLRLAQDVRTRLESDRAELSAKLAAAVNEIELLKSEKPNTSLEYEQLAIQLLEGNQNIMVLTEANLKLESDLSFMRDRLEASEHARKAISISESTLAKENLNLKEHGHAALVTCADVDETAGPEIGPGVPAICEELGLIFDPEIQSTL